MTVFHIHAGPDGQSTLTEVDLPVTDTPAGPVSGMHGIPVTSLGFAFFVERKPDQGLHPAPARQFIVVVRGEIEIEDGSGHRRRLQPGDFMFADDMDTPGHHTRDVGEESAGMMVIPVEDGWSLPTA
jgi:hypothetical protein